MPLLLSLRPKETKNGDLYRLIGERVSRWLKPSSGSTLPFTIRHTNQVREKIYPRFLLILLVLVPCRFHIGLELLQNADRYELCQVRGNFTVRRLPSAEQRGSDRHDYGDAVSVRGLCERFHRRARGCGSRGGTIRGIDVVGLGCEHTEIQVPLLVADEAMA